MLSAQRPSSSTTTNEETNQEPVDSEQVRDIHALTPPHPPPRNHHGSYSMSSDGASTENFTTMSREFNALVIAGSAIGTSNTANNSSSGLERMMTWPEETNPLAIVPDNHPLDPEPSSRMLRSALVDGSDGGDAGGEVSVQRVKKEEVETKITAWQNAKIAKINNRFKREDAIINGWESEQVQKSTSWMKKVERKLEEKRARALEKMQNEVAKAHRKAEERRASAEAKRGTKVARVLDVANLMRAVGRAPAKRSLF
ncbi:remorin [Salix suchowensis]|nr:remorin [Salix suchowensis]